jgi:hypothetical protein
MEKETFNRAVRINKELVETDREIGKLEAAIKDCDRMNLVVGDTEFDLDLWTGRKWLEEKLSLLQGHKRGLEWEFKNL